MIKFLGAMNLMLVAMVVFLYYKPAQTLFDKVVLESITCPGMSGAGASVMGVGANAKSTPDQECNARANAQLMLAAGMPDNAKMEACRTATSMTHYAKVDNCMNAERYGYDKIMADVNAKYNACGGKPKWYHPIRKKKFKKCMGRLA
jgi:hypothetical protein